jgi:hypothetical protein
MIRFLSLFKYFILAGLLIIVLEIAGALLVRSWLDSSNRDNEPIAGSNYDNRSGKNGSGDATGINDKVSGETVDTDGLSAPESKVSQDAETLTEETDDTYISSDEILSLENVSLGDKIACASIISKVSGDVIGRIASMARDGVTYSEMDEVRELLGNYLSISEIKKLTDLLESNRSRFAGN